MLYEIIILLICIKFFLVYTNGKCKTNVCLLGKTALVTGGNSGIGLETVRNLAARGCKVIIADKDDASSTVFQLKKETHNQNISSIRVDLASFESTRNLAKQINLSEDRLDILVNNAGIGDVSYKLTQDDVQLIMQVNYFSHFLLVHLLADLLKKSAASRIIHTSSIAAYIFPTLTTKNIKGERPEDAPIYSFKTYANSKLCLAIASRIFAEKFKDFGVSSNCCHPGFVNTGFYQYATNSVKTGQDKFFILLGMLAAPFFGKSAKEGADVIVHLAVADEVDNISGKFFFENWKFFHPRQAYNDKFCREIWRLSEEIVRLKPEETLDNILGRKNHCIK